MYDKATITPTPRIFNTLSNNAKNILSNENKIENNGYEHTTTREDEGNTSHIKSKASPYYHHHTDSRN